ncbi:hypothetical protein Misp01_68660 [Microtetraspora sp. NBRC 13810]|uniref:hypothetical protein n=1 Tax=Microtetraspora sp. NBRC 13810 TaxID=3030990 RepID=UPI0024A3BEED|nr:hypothetical protein [Microtetraspora sp. NBRC 13810]GLW11738.1 hypothetical protein Misp01_68660 [Microtetraspora sp. NBRC 13810]
MIVNYRATFRRPRNLRVLATVVVLCVAADLWLDAFVATLLMVVIGAVGSAFLDVVHRNGSEG